MLKAGAVILSIWGSINFLVAARISTTIVFLNADSPRLVMLFEPIEIASMDP